jgi:transcriptional regulator with XRE-family HTH domain
MTSDRSAQDTWSRHLAQALRAIRRSRQLSTIEVAQRMDLARRTYAAFEAGDGQVNIERIMKFARATDSDGYAIILSVMIGAPELAVRAADNKLLTAFTILLQEFSTPGDPRHDQRLFGRLPAPRRRRRGAPGQQLAGLASGGRRQARCA